MKWGKKMMKHKYGMDTLLILAIAGMTVGCGGTSGEVIEIQREKYEKIEYSTAEVQQGDLEPELTLTLSTDQMETIYYGVSSYDLQVDQVWVSVGDKVSKGDLLVSFDSEILQQTMESYQQQVESNQLLIEHYTKLMTIHPQADYSGDIASMKRDNEVAELYIQEAQEKLDKYQIVALKDGTITEMNQDLQNGVISSLQRLIRQVSGSGKYKATTTDDYEFLVGEVYSGTNGAITYELRLESISESETGSGQILRTLVFEPLSDMSALSDEESITMTIKKPIQKDVLYVDAAALHNGREGYYVYRLDEQGYRDAVAVTIGEQVGSYVILTGGISQGERVTVE